MEKTKDLSDNIQTLYHQINEKTKFIKLVASYLDKSPLSLRSHWFGTFWSIPTQHQADVVMLLQKTIANQTSKKK